MRFIRRDAAGLNAFEDFAVTLGQAAEVILRFGGGAVQVGHGFDAPRLDQGYPDISM